jgi:hypothetical protein
MCCCCAALQAGRAHKVALAPGEGRWNVFATTGEDGRCCQFDLRCPPGRRASVFRVCDGAGSALSLNICDYDPRAPHRLLVAGSDPVVRVFDLRAVRQPAELYCPWHMRPESGEQELESETPGAAAGDDAKADDEHTVGPKPPSSAAASAAARRRRARAKVTEAHVTGAQFSWDGSEAGESY